MISRDVSLSRLAWDVVRQSHGIEQQHHVLHVSTPDTTPASYPDIERRALDELARIGLARGHTVAPELLDTMRLLASPPLELHGWVSRVNRPTVGAVAATDRREALLAVLDERAFRLCPVRPDGLATAIVGLLPRMAPGRGRSITVTEDAYRQAVEGGNGWSEDGGGSILQSNRALDQTTADCRAMARVLRQRRLGGGQIYAVARGGLGPRRKTASPVTYLDLESGRWLIKRTANSSGAMWLVLAPASTELLTVELDALLETVRN